MTKKSVPTKPYSMPVQPPYIVGRTYSMWFDSLYRKTHGPYNPEFVPTRLQKIMRRDPQIILGLTALKSPIIGANYEIKCKDQNIAAFVQQMIENNRYDLFRLALNAIDFGFQAFEVTASFEKNFRYERKTQTKDGWNYTTASRRNCYILDKVRDLDPSKVEFVFDEKTREFKGIYYNATEGNSPTPKLYDLDRLWLFVFNEEFNVKMGNSLLTNVYTPWYFCNMCILYAMRYLEKKSDPPLIGHAPLQQDVEVGGDIGISSIAYMNQCLASLKSGGSFTMPMNYDPETKQPLYGIKELEVADRSEMFIEHMNYWNTMKLRGLLIPEQMLVQMKQTGSYSQAETHTKTASETLNVIMQQMCASMNKYLLPKFVAWEFGSNAPKVTIVPKGISATSTALFRSVIEKLLQIEPSKDYDGERLSEFVNKVELLEGANIPVDKQRLKNIKVKKQSSGVVTIEQEPKPEPELEPTGVQDE